MMGWYRQPPATHEEGVDATIFMCGSEVPSMTSYIRRQQCKGG
jgi:hypothetical protein